MFYIAITCMKKLCTLFLRSFNPSTITCRNYVSGEIRRLQDHHPYSFLKLLLSSSNRFVSVWQSENCSRQHECKLPGELGSCFQSKKRQHSLHHGNDVRRWHFERLVSWHIFPLHAEWISQSCPCGLDTVPSRFYSNARAVNVFLFHFTQIKTVSTTSRIIKLRFLCYLYTAVNESGASSRALCTVFYQHPKPNHCFARDSEVAAFQYSMYSSVI